ncbi:hypothetical protein HDIA_1300 [Hartmannibacter diazotrophicus]|uniref:DUF2267 domain-containing protein n=1 Tax=Hartmannibacter diazotrophicus TaxID=1482074 RepID=A0A2C9D4Z9_9HYPH|nr:hypothetical protein [Hartmannibacter diazotrophicus]SON54841.1 hypothetical protein HDIA_1300 [Hartmannibacter diazotrophicus]
MHELVQIISDRIGISEETAESALRIILNFLDKDGPSDQVRDLASNLGLEDFLGSKNGGGFLSGLTEMVGGGAMAAFTQLSSAGLDMGEIQGLTKEFVVYARDKAGPEAVDSIIDSIPGLEQFI